MSDVPPDHGKLKQAEVDARKALFDAAKRIADEIKPRDGAGAVEAMARGAAVMFEAALAPGSEVASDVPPDHGKA